MTEITLSEYNNKLKNAERELKNQFFHHYDKKN